MIDAPDLILHHYPTSTFSERVRLAMGLKGLRYQSVSIPPAMPKPDLLPLTGGYRRTPVLQIGADIFCDTLLILRKLEELYPTPSLYPNGDPALVRALVWWADKSIFPHALGMVADTVGHTIPPTLVAERKAFGFPLAPAEVGPVVHRHLQQGATHLGWLVEMLSDGRPFLLGQHPGAFDFAAYGPLWLLKNQGGAAAEARFVLKDLVLWYDRVTVIGHGVPVELTAQGALDIARQAKPLTAAAMPDDDPSGLKIGTTVTVTADDTGRDPVEGELVSADAQKLVIRTTNLRVGVMHLHFPRAGFDVVAR